MCILFVCNLMVATFFLKYCINSYFFHTYKVQMQTNLLLEDNDVPIHELIQGLVQRDIVVLYALR